MNPLSEAHVLRMLQSQQRLIGAFRLAFPAVRNFDLLIGCPSTGEVSVDGECWQFTKHGRGLRFVRATPLPAIVVDLHVAADDPLRMDAWRLSQFSESLGLDASDEDVAELLARMVAQGHLAHVSATALRWQV